MRAAQALIVCVAALIAAAARANAPDPGWLARAQREIAEREYEASDDGRGLQAPNRAHNLRTWFEPGGVRVHDRTAAGSPELLALSLAGVGRAGALTPVAPGEVSAPSFTVNVN